MIAVISAGKTVPYHSEIASPIRHFLLAGFAARA